MMVTRRYASAGPSDAQLATHTTATTNIRFNVATMVVNVDDAIPGAIDDVDNLMRQFGLEYAPNAPLGGRISIPEQWAIVDVLGVVDTVMSAQVSMAFDTWKALRPGSIVGLSTRFLAAIIAGTATIQVTINGVGGTLQIVHDAGSNQTGGIATQDPGVDLFNADDAIGVRIATTLGFLLNTAEAAIEIVESA